MQINIALLTITDTRTMENDKSGAILVKKIAEQKHKLFDRKIVKDDKEQIKKLFLNGQEKIRSMLLLPLEELGLQEEMSLPKL